MTVFFGFVLLLLAGAVALLFAMLGELAARLPGQEEQRTVQPLAEARTDVAPRTWPAALAPLAAAGEPALALVLSPTCAGCRRVAGRLATELRAGARPDRLAVVVSCAEQAAGEEFVRRHGLDVLPHHIDLEGAWVTGEFGIRTSPSALVVEAGRVADVLWFSDLADLREAVALRTPTEPSKEAVG